MESIRFCIGIRIDWPIYIGESIQMKRMIRPSPTGVLMDFDHIWVNFCIQDSYSWVSVFGASFAQNAFKNESDHGVLQGLLRGVQ